MDGNQGCTHGYFGKYVYAQQGRRLPGARVCFKKGKPYPGSAGYDYRKYGPIVNYNYLWLPCRVILFSVVPGYG